MARTFSHPLVKTEMLDEQRSSSGSAAETAAEWTAIACVALAPLMLASTTLEVIAATSLVGLAALLVTCLVSPDRSLVTSRAAVILAALVVVPIAQLIPVGESLHVGLGRTLYGTLGGPQGASPTSLDPAATWREILKWLGWVGLFLLLQHRAHLSSSSRQRLLVAVAASALLVLGIGIGHESLRARALFGVLRFDVQPPLLSTFGNPNHLASFLVLGAALCAGLALGAGGPRGAIAWAVACIGLAGGTLLTASRGGLLALAVAGISFAAAGAFGRKRRDPALPPTVLGACAVGLAVAMGAGLALRPELVRELVDLTRGGPALGGRLAAFQASLRMAGEHWLLGAGLGAFETAHTHYLSAPASVRFTHVESEPLQLAAELGVPAMAALVMVALLCWWNLVQRARRSWAETGAAAGVTGVAVQNLFDFSLHFATGLVALALLAAATDGPRRWSRRGAALACGLSLTLALVAVIPTWPPLDRETRDILAARPGQRAALAQRMIARHPADYLPFQIMAVDLLGDKGGAAGSLRWLNKALLLNPRSGELHLLTGVALARIGRAGQAADEFREATLAGVRSVEHAAALIPDERILLRSVPTDATNTISAAEYLGYVRHRWSPALALLERALEADGSDQRVVEELARMMVAAGKPAAAVEFLRARTAADRSAPLALAYARALRAAGQHEEAVKALERAQTWNDDGLRLELARARTDEGRLDEATSILDAVLDASPLLRSDVAVERARVCRRRPRLECARNELRRAIRLTPERGWIRAELADVYLDMGKIVEAQHEVRGLGAEAASVRSRIRSMLAQRGQVLEGLRP